MTYQCCKHCRHDHRKIDGHQIPCHFPGCKASEEPSRSIRFAYALNLFHVR